MGRVAAAIAAFATRTAGRSAPAIASRPREWQNARMDGISTRRIPSFDGTMLTVHHLSPSGGSGRPVLLLHGLFSSAQMNWIRFGHAKALAEAGFEVIMSDLRAHGESDAPHDPAAYPPGVLARDVAALTAQLELEDFDLVGFSLGARTVARAVIEGLAPRRLVLAGVGLEGFSDWQKRSAVYVDAVERFEEVKRDEPAFFAVQFMKTMKVDREAARLLLASVEDTAREELARITMPTLIVTGSEDRDNGSPQALADALPDARFEEVPGNHMGSVTKPELGQAIAHFLAA